MRILLDECVPSRLAQHFEGHEVVTVPNAGWSGVKNGELLASAREKFEVLVTVDYKLKLSDAARQSPLCILVLIAQSNKFKHLLPLMPQALELLGSKPGCGIHELRTL